MLREDITNVYKKLIEFGEHCFINRTRSVTIVTMKRTVTTTVTFRFIFSVDVIFGIVLKINFLVWQGSVIMKYIE